MNIQWPSPGSFTHRMMGRSDVNIFKIADEVDLLTHEHLEYFMMIHRLGNSETFDSTSSLYFVALNILHFVLGEAWGVKYLASGQVQRGSDNRTFLKSDEIDNSQSSLRHTNRMVSLAECLFNLQKTPGFNHRVGQLRNDDLESALGEMECAQLLSPPVFQFRFIIPTGTKGADYEAELNSTNGRTICCEIKTKSEQTKIEQLLFCKSC